MDEKTKAAEGILLTIIADIFEVIPPENPSVWAQKGSCVPVSVSYDYEKNLYRIMCVHESRCIVNSYITTDTQFMIRTGLFGTWYDVERNTTFGIGFRKLSSLHDFSYAFTKAKKQSTDTRVRMVETVSTSRKVNDVENGRPSPHRREENESVTSAENDVSQEQEESCDSQDDFDNPLGSCRNSTRRNYQENENILVRDNNNNIEATNFNGGESIYLTANAEIMTNEVNSLAKENAHLHQELLESSKVLAEWQAQLDAEKQRSESIQKANEDYVSMMDELAHREVELNIQADHWKDRYENSETILAQASDEMLIKYEQEIEEVLRSKEFFDNLVANQDSQIQELKTRIAGYNMDIKNVQNENASLKQQHTSTYDKTQELVLGATDQYKAMVDIEKNISIGAEKLMEVYDGIKRLVKRGAGSWRYDTDADGSS